MPLKLEIKVGNDSIVADGDFTIDEHVVNLTKEWVTALPKGDQQAAEAAAQAKIDAATSTLKGSQDTLQGEVGDHPFPGTSSSDNMSRFGNAAHEAQG